jgi:subtilase family serine protease
VGVISRPVRAGTVAIMGLAITAFTGTLASAGAATPAPGANLGYVALANSVPKTTDNVTGSYTSSKMQIEVAVAPRDEAGLNTMLAALYDKNSPSYHRWLSTGQFDARFAPAPATQSAVAKFLSTSGLTVVPSGSPFLVRATGSSAQIQRTFHTTLNSFKNPQGTKYFANSTPVYVPSSLGGAAMGVIGLTNTQRNAKNTKNVPHFNNTMRPGAKASSTTNCETPYPTVAQLISHRVDLNPLTLGYGAGPAAAA